MRLSNRPIKAEDLSKKVARFEVAHPKPKILLLDLPDGAYEALADKGFNVHKGFIDPRVRAMWRVRERFDRILEGGGVFVVFADAKQHQELQLARLSGG